MADDTKKAVVEKRVSSTIIRRRAKAEPSPPTQPPTEVQKPQETAPTAPATTPPVAQAPGAPSATKPTEGVLPPQKVVIPEGLEDKFRKPVRKRRGRAELEFDTIQRAGGLKHFLQSVEVEGGEAHPAKERVFEPGLRRRRKRGFEKPKITQPKAEKRIIEIEKAITVSELSQRMGIKGSDLIKKLMGLGVMVTLNSAVDADTAALLAQDYGYEVKYIAFKEESAFETMAGAGAIQSRPPVVTVMGHVDHGKTTLIDWIRKTKVAAGEAGGITQHIGAYVVTTPSGKMTFLDTPGHEAFTAMRARGARATDIVILVVAAEDGVMPQTKEAVSHCKEAGVPIIVAINKIDKPEANPDRVKRALSEIGVIPEEWGGDAICVNTSALKGTGIDQLLEMVILKAELMELKADPTAPFKGIVLEARLDRGLGAVASVLVQEGTLKVGMPVVAGLHFGRIKTLINVHGEIVEEAGPSEPVEVVGLLGVPTAGDVVRQTSDEKIGKLVSETRQMKERISSLGAKAARVRLEDVGAQIEKGEIKELKIVLKGDVHGSVEAIGSALSRITVEDVKVNIILGGVGGVTESDVMLAAASGAVIIGFNVVAETGAGELAKQEGIDIRTYSIIYDVIDNIEKALKGLLKPKLVEKVIGRAEARNVFHITKVGTIAGVAVVSGKITRQARVRLLRDNVVVHDGQVSSLRRFKDDVKEVSEGFECGIGIENYGDIKPGDIIEAYIIEEVPFGQ